MRLSDGGGVTYVLPLRWDVTVDAELDELTTYLRWLCTRAEVVVVDGSPAPEFNRHRRAWDGLVRHVQPDPVSTANGKVAGVHTGLRLARTEAVVIADDDVRYEDTSLRAVVRLLDEADLVGPQNVFDPMPWHAAWDTGRSLLNRAVAADYPGTFAVRRSTFTAMGGYDGDVLFENLELMRTVRAAGGRVLRPLDVYVRRRPPTVARFRGQRVRQAYDDFAQPWRLVGFLSVLPSTGVAVRRHGPLALAVGAAAVVAVAEAGRRRGGGSAVFPRRTSWFAPAWVAERAVCSWLAVAQRVSAGGVRYSGRTLAVAARSRRQIRHDLQARGLAGGATRGPRAAEARDAVRPVAERLAGRPAAPAESDGPAAGVDLAAG